jgi:uncharacterized membrane protein YgdD (TMEM256/DUF423 family)
LNRVTKLTLIIAAIFAMLSVAIGAFAAHALKASLDSYSLSIIETGARYQMYHALALIGLACISMRAPSLPLGLSAACFSLGIICFSGSLYTLALSSIKWVVFMTPLGGVFFIIGWCSVIYGVIRYRPCEVQSRLHKEGHTPDSAAENSTQ